MPADRRALLASLAGCGAAPGAVAAEVRLAEAGSATVAALVQATTARLRCVHRCGFLRLGFRVTVCDAAMGRCSTGKCVSTAAPASVLPDLPCMSCLPVCSSRVADLAAELDGLRLAHPALTDAACNTGQWQPQLAGRHAVQPQQTACTH